MFSKMFASAALFAAAFSGIAHAETTRRDLEVIGRALGFMEGASGSDRVVAIVHAGDAAAEAEAVAALLGGGLSAGRLTLTGRVVEAGDAAGLQGADAVLLLGSAAGDAALGQAAASGGRLTVSTEVGCATAGVCVMAVQSEPSVRIVVNRAAANAAGVGFDAAFSLMIEEI